MDFYVIVQNNEEALSLYTDTERSARYIMESRKMEKSVYIGIYTMAVIYLTKEIVYYCLLIDVKNLPEGYTKIQ